MIAHIIGDKVRGDDGRHGNRAHQREGELREKRAGQTLLKTDGNVDGDQHRRHRDDGTGQLARRMERRGKRSLPFLEMTVDVFHDNDGIVDNHKYTSDRQHHRQQGQQVDRESESRHHRERRDQRERNGDHRDDHGTWRSQEDEHHHGDDEHRFAQRMFHLVNGALDEYRRVVNDFTGHSLRKLYFDIREYLAHTAHDIEQVAAGATLMPI